MGLALFRLADHMAIEVGTTPDSYADHHRRDTANKNSLQAANG